MSGRTFWSALWSSEDQTWSTPRALVAFVEDQLGIEFDLDAAALPLTAVCPRFIGPPDLAPENGHGRLPDGCQALDALSGASWPGEVVWLNPPYNRAVGGFLSEAIRQVYDPESPVRVVVVLIFARTDVKWWHDHAFKASVWGIVKGRIRFGDQPAGAPAPSVVLVFDADHDPDDGPLAVPFEPTPAQRGRS